MMFVLRSLFWLGLAFAAIAPYAQIQEVARQAPWTALSATQAALADRAPHLVCDSFECLAAGTALAAAASTRPAPAAAPAEVVADISDTIEPFTEHAAHADVQAVPRPLPRPAWL